MENPILTVIMPVWKRPQRTRRAIESWQGQIDSRSELLCIGDGPESGLKDIEKEYEAYGDFGGRLKFIHMPKHEGKWGTAPRNHGFDLARGKWVCFLDSDDYLLPGHVGSRIAMVSTDIVDVAIGSSIIRHPAKDEIRTASLVQGQLGNSEMTIRTSFAQAVKFQSGEYGHDFTFAVDLYKAGARFALFPSECSYVVTHLRTGLDEVNID